MEAHQGAQDIQPKDRESLKSAFLEGKKPTEQDFAAVFESFVNPVDDGIEIDQSKNIKIAGSISTLGNLTVAKSVTIGETTRTGALEVTGDATISTLTVGGKEVEQIWVKTQNGAEYQDGSVTIGTSVISAQGAAFKEVATDSLTIGGVSWESFPTPQWSEVGPNSILFEGLVTIQGTNQELLKVDGNASFDAIAADEILLNGARIPHWEEQDDTAKYDGTIEVKGIRFSEPIEDPRTDKEETLEAALASLKKGLSRMNLEEHMCNLQHLLELIVNEIDELKKSQINP